MKQLKILVIGNKSLRENLGRKLGRLGHKVFFAEDGNTGIEFLKAKDNPRIDLVFTGQHIAKRLGEEIVHFIRRYHHKKIKSVLVCDKVDEVIRRVAVEADAIVEENRLIAEGPSTLLRNLFPE